MRAVPASAENLDKEDAGVHATAQDVDVVALICERGGLGGDDLQVGIDATDVAVVEDAFGLDCGGCGLALLLLLMREDAKGDEVVFDLLVGGEDGLAIVGGGAVVVGEGLLGDSASTAAIEEGFADGRAKCVNEAGFLEERGEAGALLAGRCANVERGEVGGASDANLLVGGGGAAFGGGDVRTSFEELRGKAGRDDRR